MESDTILRYYSVNGIVYAVGYTLIGQSTLQLPVPAMMA